MSSFSIPYISRMMSRMKNLPDETVILYALGCSLIPFAVGFLYITFPVLLSLMLRLVVHLLILGTAAGFFLLVLSFVCYFIFKRFIPQKNPAPAGEVGQGDAATPENKVAVCNPMDAFLSLFFQTGLAIPLPIWNQLVTWIEKENNPRRYFEKNEVETKEVDDKVYNPSMEEQTSTNQVREPQTLSTAFIYAFIFVIMAFIFTLSYLESFLDA